MKRDMSTLSRINESGVGDTKERPILTVDAFANGVAVGQHRGATTNDIRDLFHLRLIEGGEVVKLRSRYLINRHSPAIELEKHLMKLSKAGLLGQSEIIFGNTTDPFYPFEGKFDASMKFLELFQRYTPGMLHIQTRSPLIVIAMPVLKRLGKRVAVTIGIETNKDEVISKLTPGLPRVEERLKAATALRRFGVEVTLQVAPVLPYGDWKKDAGEFADMLIEHGDYIYARPMVTGNLEDERRIRGTYVARTLSAQRQFHWLRPDAATPLITAIEERAPEKLMIPLRNQFEEKQLSIFAA